MRRTHATAKCKIKKNVQGDFSLWLCRGWLTFCPVSPTVRRLQKYLEHGGYKIGAGSQLT